MDSIAPKRGRFAEVSSSPWPEHSEAPSGVGNIEELLHAHHKDNGSLPARGINVVPEIDQLELQDTGSLPQLLAASSGPRIKSAHSVNGGATNENGGLSHLISPRGPGKMMTLNSYIDGTESSTAVLSNPHEGSASLYHQFVAHSTDASHSEKPNTDYGIPPFFESAGFLEPDNHSLAKYTFTWDHPAKEVFVTGTFDEWKKSVKLEEQGGVFMKKVVLPNIRTRYRFIVDGIWTVNPTARIEDDGHRSPSNILLPEDFVDEWAPIWGIAAKDVVGVSEEHSRKPILSRKRSEPEDSGDEEIKDRIARSKVRAAELMPNCTSQTLDQNVLAISSHPNAPSLPINNSGFSSTDDIDLANPKLSRVLSNLDDTARDIFSSHDISDLWLPIPKQTLRRLCADDRKVKVFLHAQDDMVDTEIRILSGDLSVPSSTILSHSSIEDDEDLIAEHRVLGEGGYGIVEEVSILSGQELTRCVRKRIGRPKQLKGQKKVMAAFAREISVMRQVDHHHCVRFLGSYTDFDYVNILSSPVADMDLATLLDQPIHDKQRRILYRGMGCLCNAIHYLHQNNIRHEDLKPQNVLIHGDNILLTDFGFSLDFSEDSVSTTTGRPSAWTPRYSAPEVLNSEPRNRATDIYSLGCILLEMVSGFYGTSLSDLKAQWERTGNGQSSFARNDEAVLAWFRERQRYFQDFLVMPEVLHLCFWIYRMLSPQRLYRPTAQQIVDYLLDISILVPKNPQGITARCTGSISCVGLSNSRATEAAMCPSADRLRDSEQLANYLYPWNYENWMYQLFDLDLKFIYQKGDGAATLNSPHSCLQIRNACDQIYKRACSTGATEKFWKAHQRQQNHLQTQDGKEQALISAIMLSTKHVVFQRILIPDVWHPMLIGNHAVDWRVAQLTLLPICLARSPYYGNFFWMLSWSAYEFPGEIIPNGPIIDLTTTK